MFNKLLLAISAKIVTQDYTFNTHRHRKHFQSRCLMLFAELGLSVGAAMSISTTVYLRCLCLLQFCPVMDR